MICPTCGDVFTGNKTSRTNACGGNPGEFRECSNGHVFKEPVKPRTLTKEQKAIARLRKYVAGVAANSYHPEYQRGIHQALDVLDGRV